ncbi:DUF502 domain-containing protein [Halioxenophilus aromaticivorans]|uniref:DUF502 domain-containing protein n=1 Tax=Halioxenophilus aromaticivorans TaxID=1306992 RepID=UPI0031EE1233
MRRIRPKRIFSLVVKGLLTLLPLAITLYAVIWLASTLEVVCRKLLIFLLPNFWYFPGMGLMTAIALLVLVGLVMNLYGMRYLVGWGNRLVQKIPLISSVYSAISDIITVFNIGKNSELSAVVSVDSGNGFRQIGFVTGENAGERLFPGQNRVGVYLPMSYQIGGFTMYVQREHLEPLDISIEEAMRIALTGGAQDESMLGKDQKTLEEAIP